MSLGLVSIAWYPPAVGAMLLVPITEQGRSHLLRDLLARGVSLAGRGPVAGSDIVVGDRARVAPNVYDDGVIAIAVSPSLCGAAS